ncbi:MAG: hypothetical protein LBK06_07465, partial [Planctomycetaceae bacterium]|nr:hypothetical protein [Planctomycetaceae bacterium]
HQSNPNGRRGTYAAIIVFFENAKRRERIRENRETQISRSPYSFFVTIQLMYRVFRYYCK